MTDPYAVAYCSRCGYPHKGANVVCLPDVLTKARQRDEPQEEEEK